MSGKTQLSKDAISGVTSGYVVDPGTGEKMEATFKDIGEEEQQELESLEQKAKENGDEDVMKDLLKKVINDYNQDEITYSDCGAALRQAILIGFMRALGDENASTSEAEEFFESVREAQGNR